MITSSPSPAGNLTPPSAPGAVAPSIPIDNVFCEDSAKALLAIILGLSAQVLSPDAQFLALMGARSRAQKMGINMQEFDRVVLIAAKHMEAARRGNPLSCLF